VAYFWVLVSLVEHLLVSVLMIDHHIIMVVSLVLNSLVYLLWVSTLTTSFAAYKCMVMTFMFVGLIIVMGVPSGVLALGGAVVALSRRVTQHSRVAVSNIIAWMAFICLLLVVIVVPVMIQPELTYQNKEIDYLWVFYGGFLTTAFTPIGATLLIISWKIRFTYVYSCHFRVSL
jgi:nitrate reductase gamma subunit